MFNELYEAWRREKENAEIQPLAKDFFVRLAQYVKRLKEESRMLDEKSIRARLLQKESKNVKKLSDELIRLRYEKNLGKVMAGETVAKETLNHDEEKLYMGAAASVEAHQNFLKAILNGRNANIDEVKEKPKKRVLRFLQEVPSIIGADMKPYGPFKPEDVASVPSENAKILIKQALCVEVEVRS